MTYNIIYDIIYNIKAKGLITLNVQYHKKAIKFINSLPTHDKQRIKSAIQNLLINPSMCDIKPLQGYKDLYRLRVGNYRIIYTKDNIILFIADIGNRGDIYKQY